MDIIFHKNPENRERTSEEVTKLKAEIRKLIKVRSVDYCKNCFHSYKNAFNEEHVFCSGHNLLVASTDVCETFSPKDK